MRILIVDDSRIMQAGMKRALVNAGHEVTVAGDGKEGLIAARETLPDLILLDMMLPMMSGTEVLSALKMEASTKEIPIFVLTGLSQKNEDKLLHAGAAKYFEKSNHLLEHNFAALIEAVGRCNAKHV
jgi:CheY-like chemotaxis protein